MPRIIPRDNKSIYHIISIFHRNQHKNYVQWYQESYEECVSTHRDEALGVIHPFASAPELCSANFGTRKSFGSHSGTIPKCNETNIHTIQLIDHLIDHVHLKSSFIYLILLAPVYDRLWRHHYWRHKFGVPLQWCLMFLQKCTDGLWEILFSYADLHVGRTAKR